MSLKYRKSGLDDLDQDAKARFCEVDFTKTKSLTVQAPAEEVDINKIIARIQKGQTILAPNGEPFYGDVSEFEGLQDALIKVQEADDLFMQYPAEVRERFDNDPVKFVDFMSKPENTDEAIKLGLAYKKPIPESVSQPEPAPAPAEPK